MKYAAIDIGSNAVRLLICTVFYKKHETVIQKTSLVRVPIRLGEDVFTKGKVGRGKSKQLISTMQIFKVLMDVHKVVKYKACATSAIREALNGEILTRKIKKLAGVDIQIISGEQEAQIIFCPYFFDSLHYRKHYLFIDLGGGSTELTVFSKGKILVSTSFNLGTIRMIHNKDSKTNYILLKKWLKINL